MRLKINTQDEFDFQPSNLKLTNDYYAKYQAISVILDENPGIVDTVHRDLEAALKEVTVQDKRGAKYKFTSDTILRIELCQILEGLTSQSQPCRLTTNKKARIMGDPNFCFVLLITACCYER